MRRMSTLAGTAALATLATAAFSPSAQAATSGTCRLVVPAQVRIVGPYQAVKTTLSGTCTSYASSVFATWTGYTSQGAEDGVLFDSVTSDYWDIYGWHTPGVVSWREAWATEQNNWNEFTPNTPTTTVRLGSWTSLKAVRSGSRVTLTSTGTRYATTVQKRIPWQTTATLQYRPVGTTTWKTLKKATATKGALTYSYTSKAARDYRVSYAGGTTIWSSTSSTVRK